MATEEAVRDVPRVETGVTKLPRWLIHDAQIVAGYRQQTVCSYLTALLLEAVQRDLLEVRQAMAREMHGQPGEPGEPVEPGP